MENEKRFIHVMEKLKEVCDNFPSGEENEANLCCNDVLNFIRCESKTSDVFSQTMKYIHGELNDKFSDQVKQIVESVESGAPSVSNSPTQHDIDHIMVSEVVNELTRSPQFKIMSDNIYSEIARGCVSANSVSCVANSTADEIPSFQNPRNMDDLESAMSSCSFLTDSSYLLMHSDDYKLINDSLSMRQPASKRIETLIKILKTNPNDIVTDQIWSQNLKKLLRHGLGDSNNEIFELCLQIHAKFLSSGFPYVLTEALSNLTSYLFCRLSPKYSNFHVCQISIYNKEHRRLLFVFRLIIDCIQHIPTSWIRYPVKCVEEIMNSILKILNLNTLFTSEKSSVTPLHMFSVIDPEAKWFSTWLQSEYGRRIFIRISSKYDNLFCNIFSLVRKSCLKISRMRKCPLQFESTRHSLGTLKKKSYNSTTLNYLCSVQALNMMGRMIMYKKTRSFIDICLQKIDLQLCDLLHSLHSLLSSIDCDCDGDVTAGSLTLCSVNVVKRDLSMLVTYSFSSALEVGFPQLLMKSLRDCYLSLSADVPIIALIDLSMIDKVLTTKSGLENLENLKFDDENGISIIVKMLCKILNTESSTDVQKINRFVEVIDSITSKLFSFHECCRIIGDSGLPLSIVGWNEKVHGETALKSLSSLMFAPNGIQLLHNISQLRTCTEDTYSKDNFTGNFDCRLSEMAANHHGFKALISSGTIGSIFSKIFNETISEADFYMNKNGTRDCRAVDIFSKIYPSIYMNTESLVYDEEPNLHPLNSFKSLTDKLINNRKGADHLHAEKVSLSLLNIMICSLPTFLLLQEKFNIVESTLEAQNKSRIDSNAPIILDAVTCLRHHAIIRMLLIGGANERKLPPLNIHQEEDFKNVNLFSSLSSLSEYWIKGSIWNETSARNKCVDLPEDVKQLLTYVDLFNCCLFEKEKNNNLKNLLSSFVGICTDDKLMFRDVSVSHLTKIQNEGIEISLRYASNLGLIMDIKTARQDLSMLITSINRNHCNDKLDNFCFIIPSVFMLLQGDFTAALQICRHIRTSTMSVYMWLPWQPCCEDCSDMTTSLCHNIELIMKLELNEVFNCFKVSNYCPAHIVQLWLRQMFWCYLDWEQIAYFVVLNFLSGGDYTIYFIISIFKHLDLEIRLHTQNTDLSIFLKTEAIRGFNASSFLPYMKSLCVKYRPMIEMDMKSFSK